MHRAVILVALALPLAAGCAAVKALPIENPDGDSSTNDLAGGADDLLAPSDLAHGLDATPPDLTPGDAPPPTCGVAQVVVNEVQTSGSGGATDEWVELYNPCATVVNLAGCKVAYRSATNATPNDTSTIAPLNTTIAAGGYLLIANSGYSGSATPDVKP